MSGNRRARTRRDDDPVRVYADGRVAWWTGGSPGMGTRQMERRGTEAAAQARAVELRAALGNGSAVILGRRPTLASLMQDLLDHLRDTSTPEGTIRQYRSNWNAWVPGEVALVPADRLTMAHWSAIFDPLSKQATPAVVKNVARTLAALIRWGLTYAAFGEHEPFRSNAALRNASVKAARKATVRRAQALVDAGGQVALAMCPEPADVQGLAEALEAVYPGHGRGLVLVAFGAGLRINEALALRTDSLDLQAGMVQVNHQLDRYQPWPALALPKGGETREALLWSCYHDQARELIEAAQARRGRTAGWLFPPHRSTTAWADQASKLVLEARRAIAWEWTFHWLRHGYASWNLAPTSAGGYGIDPASVQLWLGHSKLTTTLDIYIQPKATADERARAITTRQPGTGSARERPR